MRYMDTDIKYAYIHFLTPREVEEWDEVRMYLIRLS